MNTLENHPSSLVIFFTTEMWERYGFYVVQSLLALYLALYFKWPDSEVYSLVGTFTALTYLSPALGGFIADRFIGQKAAILSGAVILFASYLLLSFLDSKQMLLQALAGIAVGTGLLKPNVSSLLGNQYTVTSKRREHGFTIFYIGITSGIILGTLLPSQLQAYFGWPITFFSAALGIFMAFFIFAWGIRRCGISNYRNLSFKLSSVFISIVLALLMWSACFFILQYDWLADFAFGLALFCCFFYLIMAIRNENAVQSKRTLIIALLCLISILFWAFYFQMFLSLTLFISRLVEPTLFGMTFPPPYYISVQSFGIVLLGYWLSRSKQPSERPNGVNTGNKFILAMVFMTCAYAIITLVCYLTKANVISPLFLLLSYLFIAAAELLLSPVGLSAITVLANHKNVSTMVGIFFVSLGLGAFLSGKLAYLTAIDPNAFTPFELKQHYTHAFAKLLTMLALATLACFAFNRFIAHLHHDT